MTWNNNIRQGAAAPVSAYEWRRDSPIPYLFGGMALMMGLIALALVLLICSLKKSSNNNSEKSENSVRVLETEMETPRIVVIVMAGETNPTFIATPLPAVGSTSVGNV